jgi:hypothetical protein
MVYHGVRLARKCDEIGDFGEYKAQKAWIGVFLGSLPNVFG